MRLRSLATAISSDRRGASVVELGLILPIMSFMLLGAVDMATGFGKRMALEQAVASTIQQAIIQGPGTTNYDYLAQTAADASGRPLSAVTLTKWLECDGVRQSSFDGDCTGTQIIARRVSVTITATYTPPFNYSSVPGVSTTPGLVPATITGSAQVRVQ